MPGRDEKVSDEEILWALRELTEEAAPPPFFRTAAIAEKIDINQNQTRNRLIELMEDGRVDGWQGGDRQPWVWWLPGEPDIGDVVGGGESGP